MQNGSSRWIGSRPFDRCRYRVVARRLPVGKSLSIRGCRVIDDVVVIVIASALSARRVARSGSPADSWKRLSMLHSDYRDTVEVSKTINARTGKSEPLARKKEWNLFGDVKYNTWCL